MCIRDSFTRFCAAYRRFDGIEFFPQAVRPHRCTIGAILALHIGAEERSSQPLCGIRIFAVGIHAHQYLRVDKIIFLTAEILFIPI